MTIIALKPRSLLARMWDMCLQKPERPLSILLFIVVIALWEGTVWVFDIPPIIIPSASAVAASLYDGVSSGILLSNAAVTFEEVLVGFVLGSLLGLALGAIISQFPLLEKTLYPYIVAFQTIPKIAIAPIIVIWFGFGMSSKVIISAAIAFLSIVG